MKSSQRDCGSQVGSFGIRTLDAGFVDVITVEINHMKASPDVEKVSSGISMNQQLTIVNAISQRAAAQDACPVGNFDSNRACNQELIQGRWWELNCRRCSSIPTTQDHLGGVSKWPL